MKQTLKELPHSIEAEKCLLGSLLMNGSLVLSLDVMHDHFHLEVHKKIFSIMGDLAEEGTPVDVGTVGAEIEKRRLNAVVKTTYVEELSYIVPTSANAKYYLEELERLRIARGMLYEAERIRQSVLSGADTESILNGLGHIADRFRIERTEEVLYPDRMERDIAERLKMRHKVFSTGWPQMDEYWNVRPGELTVVTGVPSHGKSSFVSALAVNLALNHGFRTAFYSPENLPYGDYMLDMLKLWTGYGELESLQLNAFLPKMGRHFLFLEPARPTVSNLLSLVGTEHTKAPIHLLVLDPWNEIEHDWSMHKKETDYISEALGKIRRFGKERNMHIVLVAHPMKLQKDKNGAYPVPTPYDISGSAHFRNKADNCLTVWRDIDPSRHYDPTQIHIQKIRRRFVGKLGVCDLRYVHESGRYV